MLCQASAAMFTWSSYVMRQSKFITFTDTRRCGKSWCSESWVAFRCLVKNPKMNSVDLHCQIDLWPKCFWHFSKGYSVFCTLLLLWIAKKVSPYSLLSIVAECVLISFWLKFFNIPECLLLSPSFSPCWGEQSGLDVVTGNDSSLQLYRCRDSSKKLMHI